MRSGTIAFLLGVGMLQLLSALPPVWFSALIPPLALALLAKPALRVPLCFMLGFLWALLRADLVLSRGLPPEIEGETVTLEGRIVGLPRPGSRSLRFELDVSALHGLKRDWPSPGRVRLSWYQHPPDLIPGEAWRLMVRLKRPYGFRNPGGFDYEAWLFQQKVRATGYVLESAHNTRLAGPHGEWINQWRQQLARKLADTLGQGPQTGLIVALAMGEQQGIAQDQWRVFSRTGTTHLVAISGQHIGLIAGFAYFLGCGIWSRLGVTLLYLAAPRFGALMALFAAFLYAALAGFSIPIQRALIMVAVVMTGIFISRRTPAFNLLLLALLLVLLLDPVAVMAAGFWLSFVSVAAILYAMSGRIRIPDRWWRTSGRIHVAVAVGLTPIVLMLFGQNPLLGPLANAVAVPWVSFIVVPLVLLGALSLMLFEPLGSLLLSGAVEALEGLWPYLKWLAGFDFAIWRRPALAPWTSITACVGVVLVLMPRGLPARWVGLIWLLPLLYTEPPRPAESEFWFTLLDVGQGLAAVVQTPRHVLIYDTGPWFSEEFDSGEAVIAPYLQHQGIDHVNTVMISHGDSDHIGGLKSLLEQVAVDRIVTSVPALIEHPRVEPCEEGQRWRWDGVDFVVLHPPPGHTGQENDRSCVLRVSVGKKVVLLPGDIERTAEAQLVRRHTADLKAQILIAPHHGSKTSSSSSFIEAVDPDYVLFPVGYRNRYGFPKEEVQQRYLKQGVITLNVAEAGAIRWVIGDRIALLDRYRYSHRPYWHNR
ncbi:MAG: DNA internalization-related competence protein ComEC/Rec2 [Pseudomonadota bacterium]|nr:DNA internalization-related competence protein ComEC/Rec2 [Pseudomonadota bacterium]